MDLLGSRIQAMASGCLRKSGIPELHTDLSLIPESLATDCEWFPW